MDKKIYLVFMCGPESEADIREIWQNVGEYVHGINCTYHGKQTDATAIYLESIKGDGEIVYTKYCNRHDFSRNQYLYCGNLKNGDWCVQIDVLERIPAEFAKDIPAHIDFFAAQGVNMVYFHSKAFLFKFHDSLQYVGNPHEGLRRNDGKGVGIEINNIFTDESKVRFSVRHLKRDKFHFVNGYLKYYLFPTGANHCLLGLEKNCDGSRDSVVKLFNEREKRRMEFLETLDDLNIEKTVDSVINLIKKEIPRDLKDFFSKEKILNDVYRYHVLEDRNFNDDHDWKNIVVIK